MKVKITGCSEWYLWYAKKMGEEFEVREENVNSDCYTLKSPFGSYQGILKKDCEILPEIPPELNKDMDSIAILKKAAELILGKEIFLPQVLIIKYFIKNRWKKSEIPSNGGEGESELPSINETFDKIGIDYSDEPSQVNPVINLAIRHLTGSGLPVDYRQAFIQGAIFGYNQSQPTKEFSRDDKKQMLLAFLRYWIDGDKRHDMTKSLSDIAEEFLETYNKPK